jgi:hypothetical protein
MCTGYDWSCTYQSFLDVANSVDCHFYFQWIPSQVLGVKSSKEVNAIVKHYAAAFSDDVQANQPIELKALRPP